MSSLIVPGTGSQVYGRFSSDYRVMVDVLEYNNQPIIDAEVDWKSNRDERDFHVMVESVYKQTTAKELDYAIGYSLGGRILLQMIADKDLRVGNLILCSPSPLYSEYYKLLHEKGLNEKRIMFGKRVVEQTMQLSLIKDVLLEVEEKVKRTIVISGEDELLWLTKQVENIHDFLSPDSHLLEAKGAHHDIAHPEYQNQIRNAFHKLKNWN